MRRRSISLRWPAIALTLIGGVAAAAPSQVVGHHASASLVSQTDGWSAGRPLRLGLHLTLAPGWHTYWSNPGDAGLAPTVTVALDGGRAMPAVLGFPSPHRLPTGPLMGYGYTGEVLLPFSVQPVASGGPLAVAVHADWLVCAAVCVPESADLALTLPRSATPTPSADAALFARADRAMPRPSPFGASLSEGGLLRIEGDGIGSRSVASAWFIPDAPGVIDQAATQELIVSDGALTLGLHPLAGVARDAAVSGVLALDDPTGQETDLLISARRGSAAAAASVTPRSSLVQWIMLALAGGLVLNLMPCVLPVLAMKAIALGRHGPGDRHRLRTSAALYTLGILGAFGTIGALTLALRSAGAEAGWGSQFQSPAFVAAIAWLLFAVGLNLAGLFEVGAGIMGTGQQGLAGRQGALGDLLTGVLAVLVATPCTAPFMGAAVAAALSGPPLDGIAIFLALGLGLAVPSLVLGFVPGAAGIIPRPGPWMATLRQLLAFPMFAATVWLVWVLSEEAGPAGVLAGLSGLLLIGFGGWLHGLTQRSPFLRAQTRRGMEFGALAVVLAALSILPGLRAAADERTARANGADVFTPARLSTLRGNGDPVFVDMSAAWCLTCLVNERLALAPSNVRAAFAAARVTTLRGDWTRPHAGVTDFLHRFGRDGVPLYVFFPGHDGRPRVLPQVLTPGLVLAAIGSRA